MAVVSNCNLPEDLYYLVDKHVWARPTDDGLVTIGITDVAQNMAKTFVACTPKKVGKTIKKGRSVAIVESSKFVGPVPNPVLGEIVEVNDAVVSDPTKLNDDPYGEGWIVKIRPEDWDADSSDLVTGSDGVEEYGSYLEQEGISCE